MKSKLYPKSFVLFLLFSTFGLLHDDVKAQHIDLPMARPAEIGLSDESLQRITDYLQREVDGARIAGAVALIARHGRIGYFEAVGQQDSTRNIPMRRDTIFRIASMTKAVTSAGVMMLVEEGKLSLSDPLSKYLPEFASPRVLADVDGESLHTVAAKRDPTIHDLLTHRSGLTYGWFGPEKLDAIYRKQNVPDLFVPINESIGERVSRVSQVPLKFQPGSNWDYGFSADVLGRVVEVASGLSLDQFFRERIFRPLRMRDTHFSLPNEKLPRLAALYTLDDDKSLKIVGRERVQRGFLKFSADYCLEQNGFYSGGSGLVSTASDYLRFLQMLLGNGRLDGVRVLDPKSVSMMVRNQIGDMQIPFAGHGDGFGFGFGIVTDREAGADDSSTGSYSWGGIFNTYFWVDPQEEMIGVLMTQIFPYDHLSTRADFKRLAYKAIDDSGFQRVYWYTPGKDHANPHFNRRQLRVNAAEASIHPKFASRSEPRASGMARILIDEDLRRVRRADLALEVWGGHPGTSNKRVSVNGRSLLRFPEVGTAQRHCTHQYPSFNLRPRDLVNGYNSLQFACDQGDSFWGHYIVDNAAIRISPGSSDAKLVSQGLSDFEASVVASRNQGGDEFTFGIKVPPDQMGKIAAVHYQGRYFGYDENGNGRRTDWHGMTNARKPYATLGTSAKRPFDLRWDTSMLPAQKNVQLRAAVEFHGHPDVVFTTKTLKGLTIEKRTNAKVTLYHADNVPSPFWSRAGKTQECEIRLDVEPNQVVAAELHVVSWTGGAGDVAEYFTLNGKHFPVAEGSRHETVYSRVSLEPSLLRKGRNTIRLSSDTKHHGIEILAPGPALMVRHRMSGRSADAPNVNNSKPKVRLSSAKDESAGGLDCYKIETSGATYFLDKVGAGLSSMIDRDGNDWLGFHPRKGSGAAGEYRGFPNAVFKEAGSYFHPRNAGTDPCATRVEEESASRVVISAASSNGRWAARYVFTEHACTFTLTKKPANHKYWVLYEGVPGGQYDDSDWWMTSPRPTKSRLTTPHSGDIADSEWIAFGDVKLNRSLVLHHVEDDKSPDHFYQMQKKMTVFGFGRAGMKKFLDSVPQSFSIQFVESTEHSAISQHLASQRTKTDSGDEAKLAKSDHLATLERHALANKGDAKAGQKLYESESAKCSTCHRVNNRGGEAGPDLSKIGNKFDRPHLIESLLYPSRQIGYGYETKTLVTTDGRIHSGLVKESSDTHVTVVDAMNRSRKIAKANIKEQKTLATSLMPSALMDTLSPRQFTDLVAYLESLSSGKSRFGSGVRGPIKLPAGFEIDVVATGISGATAMEIAPDGRVFICEQGGALRLVKNDVLLPKPFASLPVELNWERGLIGVTLAPDFPKDPHVYVVYVAKKPYTHHRVSRLKADGDVALMGSEKILLKGDDQSKFGGKVPAGHQGGAIHFGRDGKLYVGIGEQTAGTPAQRFDALQGKILRLNPDGSIPSDNPFLDRTKDKYRSIWAVGCRNPFTFAIRRSTGEILINDVGGKFEEINRGMAGANYGWPGVDHGPTNRDGITSPIHVYPQSSIGGGDFSDICRSWPKQYRGKYFFADFVHGWIKFIDPSNPKTSTEFCSGIRRPVDLRFAPDGSLYVLLRNAWVVDGKFEGGTGSLVKISHRGR